MHLSGPFRDIPLPKNWPEYIKSALLHAIALAHAAITYSRSWAADSHLQRVRLAGELDAARSEIAQLREELRIKNSRMARVPPRKRP